MITAAYRWIDRNILELGREMRLSYLPPLMVYIGAGISGLTGIVGTFFVKDYLGLSAAFLAAIRQLSHRAADARARSRGAGDAHRHCHRHLRLPGHAHSGPGRHLVDDR
jgi:hypothetical protein